MADDLAAVRAYLDAAKLELDNYRLVRALQLTDRGKEIATLQTDKYDLSLFQGELYLQDGQNEAAQTSIQEALDLAETNTQRCKALIGLASCLRLADNLDGAWQALDEAEAAAQDPNLEHDLSRLYHLRGNICFPLGRVEECKQAHEQALAFARKAGSVELEANALGGIGDAEYARGYLVAAQRYSGECVAVSKAHGLGRIEAANLPMLGGGGAHFYCNDLHDAEAANRRGIELGERTGHYRAVLQSSVGAAQITVDQNRFEEALEHIDRVLEISERYGLKRFEARALGLKAKVLLEQGDRIQAADCARRAKDISLDTGPKYCGPAVMAILVRASDDPNEVDSTKNQIENLLTEGCIGHNYFEYYSEMIEQSLTQKNWDDVEVFCRLLEDFTHGEPLPRTDFLIKRGRTLANFREHGPTPQSIRSLEQLRDEATRVGLNLALTAINDALATC